VLAQNEHGARMTFIYHLGAMLLSVRLHGLYVSSRIMVLYAGELKKLKAYKAP